MAVTIGGVGSRLGGGKSSTTEVFDTDAVVLFSRSGDFAVVGFFSCLEDCFPLDLLLLLLLLFDVFWDFLFDWFCLAELVDSFVLLLFDCTVFDFKTVIN